MKYRRSRYTRRKYSRASNPPAITLVKTKRGMQMFEPTPRYDVMLFGKFFFQLYYNTHGYVGYLPTPDGLKLDIGEHGIGAFKKEIAKLNREWAQKRVDDKDAQWLKGSNPRRSLVPKSRKTPKWLIEAVKSSLRKQKRAKKYNGRRGNPRTRQDEEYSVVQYTKSGKFVATISGLGKHRRTMDFGHSRATATKYAKAMRKKDPSHNYRVESKF